MPNKDPVVERITALRRSLGLSQEKFAKMVGVSQGQVSRVESGRTALVVSEARRWLRALGHDLVAVPQHQRLPATITNPVSVQQFQQPEASAEKVEVKPGSPKEVRGASPQPDKPWPKRDLPKPPWNFFLAPPPIRDYDSEDA